MERKVGTISRGIRCPIIREGDQLADIIVESVLEAAESEGFELRDRDVGGVDQGAGQRAEQADPQIRPHRELVEEAQRTRRAVGEHQLCGDRLRIQGPLRLYQLRPAQERPALLQGLFADDPAAADPAL